MQKVRLLTLLTLCLCGQLVQANQPNVVIIMADDMGWNDVGYHGSEIETPRLDELASQGVVLDRFYAQPVCSPTRVALMTGRAPLRLGVRGPIAKHVPTGLPLSEVTMADYFSGAGYQTALIGKWHLGMKAEYQPGARGFDYFYGHLSGAVGYWDHVHGGGLDWQRNGETLREEGYATHLLADDVIRVIEGRDKDKPLFLFASFGAPHLPNEAPEDSIAHYEDSIEDPKRRIHAAMVTELDTAIGQLVDTLDKQDMLDNTIVWFMSDNGGYNESGISPERFEMIETLVGWYGRPLPLKFPEFLRQNYEEGRGDNRPLRAGKRSVYDGGLRVPSLLYWPGKLEPRKETEMISIQDVLPTLLEATAISETGSATGDNAFDGASRWAAIQDDVELPVVDFIALGNEGTVLYQFPWKLVSLNNGTRELYHLIADPTEKVSIADLHPERVQSMQAAIDRLPQGESIHAPFSMQIEDPDFFGGKEDRPPWSDTFPANPY